MRAAKKKKNWKAVFDELNGELRNNDRKHDEHRDDMDTTIVDRQPEENEIFSGTKMLKLSNDEDWLDIIYSRKPEDLQELVTDEAVSKAIRKLTLPQKEILFLNVIHLFKTSEIAAARGVSERNIRKIRQRALESLRKTLETVSSRRAEGTVGAGALMLVGVICWPFMVGWLVADWIYPKLKAKIMAA